MPTPLTTFVEAACGDESLAGGRSSARQLRACSIALFRAHHFMHMTYL